MNLHSGEPYWFKKDGLLSSYPSLDRDLKVDVLIIGAGISGSLIGYYLAEKNLDICIIDKRDVGSGSTCASTCLLQYEIDTPLSELIEKVGKKDAVTSYLLCRDAIYKLKDITRRVNSESEFVIKRSVYVASKIKDAVKLKSEFQLRRDVGFEIEFLSGEELINEFDLSAPAALVSKDGAQLNAYRLTMELLQWLAKKNVNIYDKTEAIDIKYDKQGVKIITDKGKSIHAKHLIFANGYEAQNYLEEPYGRLHSTYAMISEPFDELPFDYLLWESARPYLYMRTTSDFRIIVGGKDEVFYSPGKRDKLLNTKTKQLLKAFQKKFPQLNFIPDYNWAGTFAETKDGLPYIGKHKDHPHSYFALGYGGNGITFSVIAAELISESILNKKKNPQMDIFSFKR